MKNPIRYCLLVFICILATTPAFTQYARLTFFAEDGSALKVRANGKYLSNDFATYLRVRVNHGNKYDVAVFVPGTAQIVIEKSIRISPALISVNYVLKRNKKGEYQLKAKGQQMEQMATASAPAAEKPKKSGVQYSYKKTESYSGPDGAYSKTEKGSGSLDDGGFNSTSTKSNTSIDDKGFNMNSETKERGVGTANTLGTLGQMKNAGKSSKGKKDKEAVDGQDLVVEDIQIAAGSAEEAKPEEEEDASVAKPEQPSEPKASEEKPAESAQEAAIVEPKETSTLNALAQPKEIPPPPANTTGISQVAFDIGFEFYIMAEPIEEYEVLFEVGQSVSPGMLAVKMKGFKGAMEQLASGVRKRRSADSQIDGIITADGARGKAIRFKENNGGRYAKVNSVMGVEIYAASKPVRAYKVLRNYEYSMPMVGKPNIMGRMERVIKKVRKNNSIPAFDAIISADGVNFELVNFE